MSSTPARVTGPPAPSPAEPGAVDEQYAPFPLTETQSAYLLGRADTFDLGNVTTHAYFEFDGEIDVDRLLSAWRGLVERHDMLRAVILPDRHEQRIVPFDALPEFPVEHTDLRGHTVADRERALHRLRERLSHEVRPADAWPLCTVAVTRMTDRSTRVHIGFDGLTVDFASWHVLYTELSLRYVDPLAVLPEIPGSFRDYVLAQARLRDGPEHEAAARYWTDRLATLPPAPRLPLATDPSDVERPRFVRRAGVLDGPRWTALEQRGRRAGLTPSALLLSVYVEVLAGWSEDAHFTVNLPRMNRLPLQPDVNGLVGEFASFSLIEVDLRDRDDFLTHALRLQERLWSDLSNSEVTGAWQLRQLRRRSGLRDARMPVVLTSTLAWSDPAGTGLDAQWEQVHGVSQTPQVYLDVQLDERADELHYNWDAVEAVLSPAVLDAMFAAFGELLVSLADSGSDWTGAPLDVRPRAQRERHAAVRGPSVAVPDEPVQAAFLRRADATPDRPVVVTSGRTLSYRDLRDEAARLAARLGVEGVRPGDRVAVVTTKGWEQFVAVYAVLFAGAAYVPIDADVPPARLSALVERSGAAVVITRPGLLAATRWPDGYTVLAVEPDPPGAPVPTADLTRQHGHDVLYALFTSGSTGTPKAVQVEHAGMVNALSATVSRFGIGGDDVGFGITALHHDMSAFELFGLPGAGAAVVLPEPSTLRDPARWRALMARHGVTVWNSVPALVEMLTDGASTPARSLAALRLVFTGGDWIPPSLPADLRRCAPGAQLVGVGGPTETTLWNVWYPVGGTDTDTTPVPYGYAVANNAYHVLDAHLRDRPDGVRGELYCSGIGVSRGYLGDEERTAAVYVRHPVTGERLYRTGDLGRFRPDGALEFLGRADHQVKVRGQRIEPGEIEAALATHPSVATAVVVPVTTPGRRDARALVAHVRPVPGRTPEPELLRDHLREQLPAHLVPSRIRVLAEFPLTPNGKVDRAALTEWASSSANDPPPAPAAGADRPLDELLTREWANGLGLDTVGPDDDFYALGGDSLLGARILTRLRRILDGERLSATTLFDALTVTKMAAAIRRDEALPGRSDTVARTWLAIGRMSPDEVGRALAEERERR